MQIYPTITENIGLLSYNLLLLVLYIVSYEIVSNDI